MTPCSRKLNGMTNWGIKFSSGKRVAEWEEGEESEDDWWCEKSCTWLPFVSIQQRPSHQIHSGRRDDGRKLLATHGRVHSLHLKNNNFPFIFKSRFQRFASCELQSASIAWSQGLLDSLCGSSPGRWAILQLLCSQARRKLKEEPLKKITEPPETT